MSAPSSRLSIELDHALGASLLSDEMLEWRPTSKTQQSNLLEETLAHSRAVANVLTNLLEHRAVTMDAETQSSSGLPLRWWGVKPTLSGIYQLDEQPEPHSAQEEILEAPASTHVNPRGYTDPTRSASFPTDVNNVLTRFVDSSLSLRSMRTTWLTRMTCPTWSTWHHSINTNS
jgi:hypothetical protein